MEQGEQIEIMLAMLLRRLFGARYVEIRVPSGAIANLYAYMATTRPGDRIMSFAGEAGGHATHHAVGAAGLYGLEIHPVPFDADRMDIDPDRFAKAALELTPKLIVVAGSLCLFPYSLSVVRQVADQIGAYVLYDAAHMGGLIAGGRFQQPLHEGADLMTGSTYKSFGGPPSGFVATNSAAVAERLDRIAFPGLTANFDLSRTAAMVISVLDLLEHGPAYASMCIANAQALGGALHDQGCDVHQVPGRGYTESHHLAIRASKYGGGGAAANRLAAANLLTAGIGLPIPSVPGDYNGIRIGTQEITRWGLEPEHMSRVAELIARVLVNGEAPAAVEPAVTEFRARFQTLHYVR
jgi:glycine hydroxymethyltransferase